MRIAYHSLIILLSSIILFSCTKDPKVELEKLDIDDTLLYSKNPNGHNELHKLENGVESLILSDPEFDYWWAKVSPNKSKMLVYRSPVNPDKNHDDYGNADLILANIDGSAQEVLIEKGQYGWRAQGVCRWNKNGDRILMCAEIMTDGGFQWRLVETNLDGSDPVILSEYWAIDCNYSTDDQSVVFMGFPSNELNMDLSNLELLMGDYDVSSSQVSDIKALTTNSTRDHDPDFSPDGQSIVFSAGNKLYTDVDIVIYDLASGTEKVLVDDSGSNGGSMCWSQDGSYIFFHSVKLFRSPFRIRQVEVATGEVTTLLQIEDNSFGFFHPEAY